MARLRFPGRPGHRFDRLSVEFFADDVKNIQDPSLAFLPQFQSGLRLFRNLVGYSDEEDEFEGFTEEEISASQEKFNAYEKAEKKKEKRDNTVQSLLPRVVLGRGRPKNFLTPVVPYNKTSIIETIPSPSAKQKVLNKEVTSNKILKPRKFKLDYKHGLLHKDSGPKSKKSEKDMAKFLLEKARQANLLYEQAKARRLAAAKLHVQKKEFVLPTQSSRSSRVIKPNKRFLEDDSIVPSMVKTKHTVSNESLLSPPSSTSQSPASSKARTFSMNSSQNIPKLSSPRELFAETVGLFDQPLIVDGKRDRKPSLKLQLSDEDSSFLSQSISPLRSPLAAPKLGTGLFKQSQFQKSDHQPLFTSKKGSAIVQKAKLQLNRAALNKSKAALARSLKAEMKREAKYISKQKELQEPAVQIKAPLPLVKSERLLLRKKLMKKFKNKCCVCGKEQDLLLCFNKLIACNNCRRFYLDAKTKAEENNFIRRPCQTGGRCNVMKFFGPCRDCRLKKCLNNGFPLTRELAVVYGLKFTPTHDAEQRSLDAVSTQRARQATSVQTTPAMPIFLKSPVTPGEHSRKNFPEEEELSPLKISEGSEKKQRKRKAFKELLKTKQEKEDDEGSQTHDSSLTGQDFSSPVAMGSVEISPKGYSSGPRIKHVCRNAAVALGRPLATFPEKTELRLSALPTNEKAQLLRQESENKSAIDMEDDRPMEEIIQKSSDSVVVVKKSPTKLKLQKKLRGAGGLHLYKRKMRCKNCKGCKAPDCGECRHCLDKPKFGGPGVMKQACVDKPKFGGRGIMKQCCENRKCLHPVMKRSATEAFIEPKVPIRDKIPRSFTRSVNTTDITPTEVESPSDLDLEHAEESDLDPIIPGVEDKQSLKNVQGLGEQTGMLITEQDLTSNNSNNSASDTVISKDHSGSRRVERAMVRDFMRSAGPGSEVRRLIFEKEGMDFQLEKLPTRRPGKLPTKLAKNLELNQKYTRKEPPNDGQCYPVSLQSINPASRQWGSLLSQPKYFPIKVDFKRGCDVNSAWRYGLALTMSTAMSVRALCFLCGSSGKHELIYCNICCEPFHEFCLEDWEQPEASHYDDWICPACQFCHVCGRQNNLLQCDKCQNTYHPGCLGPNYPTKPSKRKNIWICTKCVKCKSCGATTPGSATGATWTYDFSLCYECGLLMDKGNFCPICKKCYSDDDWETKMIQCNMCDSWVHSKCEGLSDEMYQILSTLPEDLSFYCRKCFPVGCPEWETTLKREMREGLENILQTLILAKSAQYILKNEKKKSPTKLQITAEGEETNIASDIGVLTKSGTAATTQHCVKDLQASDPDTHCDIDTRDDVKDEELDDIGTRADEEMDVDMIGCDVMNKAANTQEDCDGGSSVLRGEGNHSTKVCDKDENSPVGGNDTGCDLGKMKEHLDHLSEDISNDSDMGIIDIKREQTTTGSKYNCVIACDKTEESNKGETNNMILPEECAENLGEKRKCAEISGEMNVHAKKDNYNLEFNVNSTDVTITPKPNAEFAKGPNPMETEGPVDGAVVPRRPQVQFETPPAREDIKVKDDPESDLNPRDLIGIAQKMKEGHYKSVAVFCEDILRVVQTYLDDEEEARAYKRKAVTAAKGIFAKQVEKVFPWFNVKECRHWYSSKSFPKGMLPDATLPPSTDHTYAQWIERVEPPRSPQPSPYKKFNATPVKRYIPYDEDLDLGQLFEGEDERPCMFCQTFGDQRGNEAGRLLYCGQDDWCHINCALWSAEVYEDADGALMNLAEAFSRGKQLRCDVCDKYGATVGCNTKGCKSNYHFMCARRSGCLLQEDKKVFCQQHLAHVDGEVLKDDMFNVLRRVYAEDNNIRSTKKRWAKGLNVADVNVLVGSCCVESLGRLTDLSDKPKYLQPVDFLATRIYWSTKDPRRRCVYTCRIVEVRPETLKSPTVSIKDIRIVHDMTHPDFVPLESLDLSSLGINLHQSLSRRKASIIELDESEDPFVDVSRLTEGTVSDPSGTLSAEESLNFTCDTTWNNTAQSNVQGCNISQFSNIVPSTDTLKQRRASIGGLQSRSSPQTDPDKLSVSWPRSNSHKCTEHKHAPNLSFLSPKTLKLLNIKDPSLYQPPVNNNADVSSQGHEKSAVDDLCLIKIADRLNNAAARSSKRTANGRDSRSPSIERIVPPSVSQPFSPIASGRFSKAQSVDRNSPTTAFTSKLMDLPNAPFSPKFAMFPRTRSASMDNKSTCDTIVKGPSILEPLNDNNIRCLTRERSVSDPVSPTPKPVGFSSPVAGKSNSVTIMESKNAGQSLENIQNKSMDFSVKSCSEINGSSCLGVDSKSSDTNFDSYAEDDVLEVKLNNLADASEASEMFTSTVSVVSENPVDEAEYSETIVVMTESGESLSEEDALKIAEELINKGLSNIVEQTDQDIQYGDNRSGCDDLDIDETSEKDTKVFDGELSRKTSSPFIPEMAASYNPLTDKHPGVIQERNLLGRETIQRKLLPVSITQTVRNSSSSSLESGPDSLSNNTLELNAPDEETKVVFSIGGNEEEQHLSTIVDDSDDDVEVLVVDPVSDSDSDVLDITDSILGISTHGNSTAVILAEDESNTFTVPNNNADKSELDIVSGIRKHENTFEKSMGISDITGLQNNDEVDGDRNVRMEGNVEVTEISKLENKQTINSSCPKAVRGSENEQVANTELPVLDPIAKKIKEESIAKSCPEEKGPFKCNNCKREYRTESSYQVHVENCNFCVSSSDDDDDEEESENGHEVNTKKTNGRVTRSNRRNSKQIKTTLDEDPQTVEETIENPKSRTSLRQSTVCQRVAHEVEEQRVKQESNAPKRRGRPSLNKNFSSHERSKDADQSSLSESDMNYTSKEKIMNTRRSAKVIAEEANDSVKTNNEKEGGQCMVKTERDRKVKDKAVDRRMTRSKSQESHSLESEQIKVECESEHVVLANLVNRKRHLSKNSTESGTSNIDIEVHSPQTKRRTVKELSACDSEDVLNTLEESSKELAVNDSIGERPKKRGRPKKHTSANPKNADGQADVKCNVDAKMDDVGSSEFVRVNNTSSEINTQAISTFSGMENDTDNKGETIIESDISFSKSTDSNGSKKDLKVSEKSQSGTGDGKHTCNSGCEHESETEELRTKDSDSDDAMQISDTDKIPVQPDQEMNHVAQTDARNTSFEANTDLTSVSPNPREMKTISPSNQSLPAAVLKLLKEGHKVVIRNPKLNKNFLWQKTENGYIGKPFDKELPLQSNIKTNNSGTSSKETGLTGPATDVSKAADVNKQVPSFLGQNMSSPKQMGLTNQQQASNNQLMNNITFSTLNQSDVKTQAKFVVENIQKLIEQNRQAKVASTTSNTVPVFVRGDSSTPIMAAEYIGGILISPSKANYILDDIKNTIQCTAPIADQTIQNTLQFQQQFGSPPLNNIQQSPPSYSILSPLQQQYPIMSQHFNGALDFQGSGFPTYSTGLTNIQTGFASVQPGLFQTGLNTIAVSNVQIFNQCGMQTQNSTLQAAISPIPVLNMGYISVPISSISTQQVINQPSPVLNQSNAFRPGHVPFSFATVVNSGNGQMTPYMSSADQSLSTVTTVTNASLLPTVLQNIMSKPFSASPISTVSLSQHTNLPQSVSSHSSVHGNLHSYNRTQSGSVKMYDKIKSLLSKRRSLSTRKTYTSKELKRKSFVNVAKVLDSNGTPVITVKDHNTAIDTPVATTLSASNQRMSWPNKLEMLKLKRKYVDQNLLKSPTRLKRKYKKRKKMAESTLPDGNSRISAPHYGSKPTVMHSQKESTTLPVAAMEEEVRDVPLSVLEDERSPDYAGVEGHNLGHLEFEIASDDGFTCRADTMDGAWKQVTEKLQDARTASRQKHLSYAGLSGVQMFGLSHPQVVYLVEQMHGASYCRRYAFKYHKHELVEREIELLNPTGCIRTEPFSGRNPWDMFSFLMSRYRQMPSLDAHGLDEEMALKSARRATSMDLPMAMRFRKLKEFSKECVGVYRSKIHGRGLFCKRSIDAGEMIIEYAGEVIRNALTDVREKYYESKGIGCYMFRIDEFDVVDATMRGSAARFINHSCEPNCYSKVITVDNRKHIVIFAMRKILRGEELTYDYKFPIEEVKIPCTCGARKCRKYLN